MELLSGGWDRGVSGDLGQCLAGQCARSNGAIQEQPWRTGLQQDAWWCAWRRSGWGQRIGVLVGVVAGVVVGVLMAGVLMAGVLMAEVLMAGGADG